MRWTFGKRFCVMADDEINITFRRPWRKRVRRVCKCSDSWSTGNRSGLVLNFTGLGWCIKKTLNLCRTWNNWYRKLRESLSCIYCYSYAYLGVTVTPLMDLYAWSRRSSAGSVLRIHIKGSYCSLACELQMMVHNWYLTNTPTKTAR